MFRNAIMVIFAFVFLFINIEIAEAKERQGNMTIKVNVNAQKEAKKVRLWIPYPVSDEHQRIEDVNVTGNFLNSAVYREPASGALYIFADWIGPSEKRVFELGFKVWAEERSAKNLKETVIPIDVEVKKYLESSEWIPTDGKVKEIADTITKGKKGILEKSRSVYDWVVENTYRDPNVKGCGLGIVEETLSKRGGKCADISSVYVALARAAGVPAREVFGLRLGKKPEEDMTGGHHCWAEFYLPGTGWVPVDPADVRKIMLTQKIGLDEAKHHREYYFASVDEYRIVLERGGRGVNLQPPQEAGPVNYFMYPYAEVDGKALDYLDPKSFSCSIYFKAL